jgi:hypothetical protein
LGESQRHIVMSLMLNCLHNCQVNDERRKIKRKQRAETILSAMPSLLSTNARLRKSRRIQRQSICGRIFDLATIESSRQPAPRTTQCEGSESNLHQKLIKWGFASNGAQTKCKGGSVSASLMPNCVDDSNAESKHNTIASPAFVSLSSLLLSPPACAFLRRLRIPGPSKAIMHVFMRCGGSHALPPTRLLLPAAPSFTWGFNCRATSSLYDQFCCSFSARDADEGGAAD